MEGFSFVMPVTGLNGPNIGNEDDYDDNDDDDITWLHLYFTETL
jgi:hypothetical protein